MVGVHVELGRQGVLLPTVQEVMAGGDGLARMRARKEEIIRR